MEEKVLHNVLKHIGTGKEYIAAPDKEYLESLEKLGWTNSLTEMGRETLRRLNEKQWGGL